ncbi:hypothetical protein [Mycobacterium stomatepiae]|uniref:hypothetical protein n=1 Tax=Mycobacterium stomatepiae TaxID=470076 RepID=UPI0013D7BE85|nr:hypothetical protein [Mycobacterium stomatepiae]MCV7166262.1 hypothetical protein [Mycobacterium stomatepiae]
MVRILTLLVMPVNLVLRVDMRGLPFFKSPSPYGLRIITYVVGVIACRPSAPQQRLLMDRSLEKVERTSRLRPQRASKRVIVG